RIEPHLVGDNREAQQVCWPELLRGCLVAELDQMSTRLAQCTACSACASRAQSQYPAVRLTWRNHAGISARAKRSNTACTCSCVMPDTMSASTTPGSRSPARSGGDKPIAAHW